MEQPETLAKEKGDTRIRISGLGQSFVKDGARTFALRDLDLEIERGSFVVFLGRSGCGKSTLLNAMAGLLEPTEGTIEHIDPPNGKAKLGYLTQHDSLLPWRNTQRNIELPLELEHVAPNERAKRAVELISRVRLEGYEKHYPRELSGGMRRRASLARMLCPEPDTLLMDEPFGALDAQLRHELQAELLRLWQGSNKTVVFVTHDLDEALSLGDRIVVLGKGGEILLDQDVPIERPRDLDRIRIDPEFIALYEKLVDTLKEQ